MKSFTDIVNENNNIKRFNKLINYTFLKEVASIDDIRKVCDDAKENQYNSVIVRPDMVSYAKSFLENTDIQVCAVISYPKGDDKTHDKIKEASDAITEGADELDVVMDYKLFTKAFNNNDTDDLERVSNTIRKLTELAHGYNSSFIKIIIEIEALNYDQIKSVCDMCTTAGVDCVKTSTGYFVPGLSLDDKLDRVKFMRKMLPDYITIEVSGGWSV
jgi:deoxyribose-phosphate aldolase